MSPHRPPEPPAFPRRRGLRTLCTLVFVAGVGLAAGSRLFSAAPTAPAAPEQPVVADVVLARAALAALDADPELKSANLVVSVVDRVAVLGGPVGSADAARRAEAVVRRVPGIADVRNTCFVGTGPDPLLKAVADRLGSTLPERPVMTDLPGVLTNTFTPGPTVAAGTPSGAFVVRRPPTGADGVLGAPVGPTTAEKVGPGEPDGTLTAGSSPERGGLPAAVGEVRRSEPRFARLTVEVRDGTLVVGGSAPLASDAWDFAQKLRQLPGVTRVAIGAVSGK